MSLCCVPNAWAHGLVAVDELPGHGCVIGRANVVLSNQLHVVFTAPVGHSGSNGPQFSIWIADTTTNSNLSLVIVKNGWIVLPVESPQLAARGIVFVVHVRVPMLGRAQVWLVIVVCVDNIEGWPIRGTELKVLSVVDDPALVVQAIPSSLK